MAMAMAQVLLGDDGRGYDLARRLEGCGVWRTWLGDSGYAAFAPSLASASAWESFVVTAPGGKAPSRALLHLQLRVRALLYDKASVALFLGQAGGGGATPVSLSSINSTYLQLHGDDVYFSLDGGAGNGVSLKDGAVQANLPQTKAQPKAALAKANGHYYDRSSGAVLRLKENETEAILHRNRNDELPDLWYDQFYERYKASRHYKLSFGDKESLKRTPEGMSSYLKHLEVHKRRRQVFREDQSMGSSNSVLDNESRLQSDMNVDDTCLLPEFMFPSNCIPETVIPLVNAQQNNSQKDVDVYGVLDSLPHLIRPTAAMIERYGIKPEYIRVEFGRSKYRGKSASERNRKSLSQEQAYQVTQKVVARVLMNAGLDGGTEILMGILSQFIESHIIKLGRKLKLLSDSYRKQFSSTELIKMFLKTAGFSNLGLLSDYVKDGNRVVPHQNSQMRSFQAQHQAQMLQNQQHQVQRLINPQLNAFHSQNLVLQQQQINQQQMPQQTVSQQLQQQQQQMRQQQLQQHRLHQQQHQQQQQQRIPQQQISQQQMQQQVPQQQVMQQQVSQQQMQQQPVVQQQTMLQQQQQIMQHAIQQQTMQQQVPQQTMQQQALLQMQQHMNPQQIQQQLRRRQMSLSSPRTSVITGEADKQAVEIKTENMSEPSTDGSFNMVNRQQLLLRQQAALASGHAQTGAQIKQFTTVQSPQGSFSVRSPPVKVEGFQELMGGDSSLKHESDERKLTSPSK